MKASSSGNGKSKSFYKETLIDSEEINMGNCNNNYCPLGLEEDVRELFQDVKDIKTMQYEGLEKLHSAIDNLRNELTNPREGLYPRVMILEKGKETSNKIFWIFLTAVISVIGALSVKYFS